MFTSFFVTTETHFSPLGFVWATTHQLQQASLHIQRERYSFLDIQLCNVFYDIWN